MRQDLTEAEIRELLRHSDLAVEGDAWSIQDAKRLRNLVGELQKARDREAAVMHLHQIEGVY